VGFLKDWAKKLVVPWDFDRLGQKLWCPVGFLSKTPIHHLKKTPNNLQRKQERNGKKHSPSFSFSFLHLIKRKCYSKDNLNILLLENSFKFNLISPGMLVWFEIDILLNGTGVW
jgi:hypothetical protein